MQSTWASIVPRVGRRGPPAPTSPGFANGLRPHGDARAGSRRFFQGCNRVFDSFACWGPSALVIDRVWSRIWRREVAGVADPAAREAGAVLAPTHPVAVAQISLEARMPGRSLRHLFVDELQDMYDAEQRIAKAMPKLVKAANSSRLSAALEDHLEETEMHVSRLERVFEVLGESP